MEIANEESIYQANTISTKQGEGPVQKKKKMYKSPAPVLVGKGCCVPVCNYSLRF